MKPLTKLCMRILTITILLMFSSAITLISATNTEQQVSEENVAIEEQILYQDYAIAITSVTPMKGRTNRVNSGYYIKVDGIRAMVYLPYFGRMHTAPLGKDGNIKFDNELYDYKYQRSKTGEFWQISFKVAGQTGEVFHFNIKVYNNRSCSINISTLHRNSIWYEGDFRKTAVRNNNP